MKKNLIAMVGTVAALLASQPASAREIHVSSTGQAPVNRCGSAENQIQGAIKELKLDDTDAASLRAQVASGGGEVIQINSGFRFDYYTQCKAGKVASTGTSSDVVIWTGEALPAHRYTLPSGRMVGRIDACGNWYAGGIAGGIIPPPIEVTVTYAPPPEEPRYEAPVVEERVVSEEVAEAAKIEYEAIAGVWVGASGLANFRGAYGEAMVKFPLGDGWAFGVGGMGMIGEGESRVSDYSWDEHRYGPSVGISNDRLTTRTITDQYGQTQTVSLPVHDGLKLRYLWDGVSGRNPTSGYAMSQKGHGINIYAEHVERTSPTHLWGVTGEAFIQTDATINSTWSGDSPQNRSMYGINAFGQDVLDDDWHWQLRYGAGLSHQAWDKVNYLSLFAEVRYDETIMCGPRLSLALNRPDSYKPYSINSLHTLMGFCRLELGGKLRAWDRHRREERVQLVQTGWRRLEDGEPIPDGAREVTVATPTPSRGLDSIDLSGITTDGQ